MKQAPPQNQAERKLFKLSRLNSLVLINLAVVIVTFVTAIYPLIAVLMFFDILAIDRFYLQASIDGESKDKTRVYMLTGLILLSGILAIILVLLIALVRT